MVNLNSLNPFSWGGPQTTTITQLRVYPIKSCRGVSLPSANLTTSGLELDRSWMFVDPSEREDGKQNVFMTIRQISKLTLIDTALAIPTGPFNATDHKRPDDPLELIITFRHDPSIRVAVPARPSASWLAAHTKLVPVEIWESPFDGWMCEDSIDAPFIDVVGKPVKLVYKGPTPRLAGLNGSPALLGREATVNYPDVMPVQIANEASLAELNSRLTAGGHDAITIERFRPNIIVSGGVAPWAEDEWKTLRILPEQSSETAGWFDWITKPASNPSIKPEGALDVDVPLRCARCQVPNVNPDTAEKHRREPWLTLKSYRCIDAGFKTKPCFGMLCAPRDEGIVKIGMQVQILDTTKDHMIRRA